MLSWPLLRHLRDNEGYDTIIGPSALETEPTFEHWVIASSWREAQSNSIPLILLDAFGKQDHKALLLQLQHHPEWAVIADIKLLSVNVAAALQASGATPSTLSPFGTEQVYIKGWWRTGEKATAKGKKLTI